MTVSKFSHSWSQFSVIARFEGTSSSSSIVVLGAHEDSINLSSPSSGRAPGADDDGSGTVNLMEIFRALIAADFKPSYPVEFHWYSGEEAGLLGELGVVDELRVGLEPVGEGLEVDRGGGDFLLRGLGICASEDGQANGWNRRT